jgi:hypothetical protein
MIPCVCPYDTIAVNQSFETTVTQCQYCYDPILIPISLILIFVIGITAYLIWKIPKPSEKV